MPTTDFNTTAENLLPPHRRQVRFKVLAKGFVYPLVWLNTIFENYKNGSTANAWDTGITYNLNDTVVYNFGVYISLVDGNIANIPDFALASWLKVQDSFIGATERTKYNASRIVFEYALNKYFGTIFNQPPTLSDIYITDDVPEYTSFMMSAYDTTPVSYMYANYSTGIMFDPPVYAVASFYKFTINIPTATYVGLGANAEQIIRNFADKYTLIGTTYTINQY